MEKKSNHHFKVFLWMIALATLGASLASSVLSNYFNEVYNVSAAQRGFIEFPRELPGVLTILVIAGLSAFSDSKLLLVAQGLSIFGILTLGLVTPSYSIMLLFIFINSLGQHMNMPLQDAIGMELMDKDKMGKQMGQFKGITSAFFMVSSLLIFLGFRFNIFSFQTEIKWVFVASAAVSLLTLPFILYLYKYVKSKGHRVKFVFRKEYKYYYTLVVMYGVQKQIMLVYGPWVLISLLGKQSDTIALLGIIGSFAGIFFIPRLGKWLDQYGVRKLLFADALSFIFVYIAYGILAGGFTHGTFATVGLPLFLTYALFIIDRMSNQMGMIRTVYLKKIAVEPSDVTPTLSLGLSLDHIVSIICAMISGIVWGKFGPQYIFYGTAILSLVNLFVAFKVHDDSK